MGTIFDTNEYFDNLLSSVNNCDLCPRMNCRKKVLSRLNGSVESKVLFIAEAPGRLGAECTGMPLCGDRTGDTFESFLGNIGWKREDVFITNAILCNPQDENGNNATPNKEEINNCSYYLSMTIELVNPDIIATIGGKALEAIKYIEPHHFSLKNDVATLVNWNGRKLFPLYHMSPRALIHRPLIKQRGDFIALSHIADPQKGLKKKKKIKTNKYPQTKVQDSILIEVVKLILKELRVVTFFKLMKMLYLIDYNYFKQYHRTLTDAVYLRMQEGPWIPTLNEITKQNAGDWCTLKTIDKKYSVTAGENVDISLDKDVTDFVFQYINKYRDYDDSKIKQSVYITNPMKFLLRKEKAGKQTNKATILYKDNSIEEIWDSIYEK